MAALGLDFALRRGNEDKIVRETASYSHCGAAAAIKIRLVFITYKFSY